MDSRRERAETLRLRTLPFRFRSLAVLAGFIALLNACERRAAPPVPASDNVLVRAELRSWRVAGRARHLYLQLDGPSPYDDLDGRIEFTSLALRREYLLAHDRSGAPRLGRMTPGEALRPMLGGDPDDRLEAIYTLSLDQARCITRDRVFSTPYVLLGTNSNTGLRRTMESCGLGLPERVLSSGGVLGEFPGIEYDPGVEVPESDWASFGLTSNAAVRSK